MDKPSNFSRHVQATYQWQLLPLSNSVMWNSVKYLFWGKVFVFLSEFKDTLKTSWKVVMKKESVPMVKSVQSSTDVSLCYLLNNPSINRFVVINEAQHFAMRMITFVTEGKHWKMLCVLSKNIWNKPEKKNIRVWSMWSLDYFYIPIACSTLFSFSLRWSENTA